MTVPNQPNSMMSRQITPMIIEVLPIPCPFNDKANPPSSVKSAIEPTIGQWLP
jgi:hypothetical protein